MGPKPNNKPKKGELPLKKKVPPPPPPEEPESDEDWDPVLRARMEKLITQQDDIPSLETKELLQLHDYCTETIMIERQKRLTTLLNVLDKVGMVFATTIYQQNKLLAEQRSAMTRPRPTYASAAATTKTTQPPPITKTHRNETTIVVKSSNNTSPGKVKDEIKSLIRESKANMKINSVTATQKVVLIKAERSENSDKLVEEINKNKGKFQAYKSRGMRPTVVIRDIDVDEDLTTIVEQICNRNDELNDLDEEFEFMFQLKGRFSKPGTISLAFRVTPNVFNLIFTNLNGLIRLDTKLCAVQHKVFVRQCQNCYHFDHKTGDCKNKQTCRVCGQEKTTGHQCTHLQCCTNCAASPKHQNNKDHYPNTESCPLYGAHVQRILDQTQLIPNG